MSPIKHISKKLLSKSIVGLLLAANVAAFVATENFFSTRTVKSESTGEKDLVSNIYTGWKMIDWSFSLVDYFRNVGDRKN